MSDDDKAVSPEHVPVEGESSSESDRRPSVGAVPGTLVVDEDAHPTQIRLLDFGPEYVEEHDVSDLDQLDAFIQKDSVTWIDVSGFRELGTLEKLSEKLGLHRLVLADAVNIPQRSKTELYPEYLLFITQAPYLDEEDEEIDTEQVSIVVGTNFVLSFQELPLDDTFQPVRDRIRNKRGLVRTKGPGYLGYALVAVITDEMFPLLDDLEDSLEVMEQRILDDEMDVLEELYTLKHQAMDLRRAIEMHRDAVSSLQRVGPHYIPHDVQPFLRDVHDQCVSQVGTAQSLQDFAVSLRELLSSAQANRMNDVMKLLTVVATIFIPLSFFAGVYGMNFDTSQPGNMPELGMPYGYWIFWGCMAAVVLSMLWYFRHRKWL
jgi:magnesium transporter